MVIDPVPMWGGSAIVRRGAAPRPGRSARVLMHARFVKIDSVDDPGDREGQCPVIPITEIEAERRHWIGTNGVADFTT